MALDECKAACAGMGDCAELVVSSSNGCCFPATERCEGQERTGSPKYLASECPDPRKSCWREASNGDHWCGVTHPGQEDYDEGSGAYYAALYGGTWGYDASHGWRFCQLSIGECMAACLAMDEECAEVNLAPNGCCFIAKEPCQGSKRTGDLKLKHADCYTPPSSGGACEVIAGNVGQQQFKGRSDFSGDCVRFSDDTSTVGQQAFEDAQPSLITIPPTVTSLGDQAFKNINKELPDADKRLVVSYECATDTLSWPILTGDVDVGQDCYQDTTVTTEYTCPVGPEQLTRRRLI